MWQGIYHGNLCMDSMLLQGTAADSNLQVSGFCSPSNRRGYEHDEADKAEGLPSANPMPVAPELLACNRVHKLGADLDKEAIDVWASGTLLVFLLTGMLPFVVSACRFFELA